MKNSQFNFKSIFFSVILGLFLLFIPSVSYASIWTTGLVPCAGLDCTTCDIFQLLKNLLDLIWDGSWVVAAVMLIYGGFMYMQNAPDKAKKILTNTAIGIAIAFFGWLAVDTVIKIVANKMVTTNEGKTIGKLGLGPWNKIELDCTSTRVAGPQGINAGVLWQQGNAPVQPVAGDTGGATIGEVQTCAILKSNNISVNDGHCDCVNNDGTNTCNLAQFTNLQTRLAGLRQPTIDALVSIQNECADCDLTITGGTEEGHSENGTCTHENGYKVDLRLDPALYSYITNTFEALPTRRDGAFMWGNSYLKFAKESDHWDVSVGCNQ